MTDRRHLLPPNASPLEKAVSLTDARLLEVPTEIARDVKSPANCPPELLPYLALERGVKDWDAAWPEATRRAVVAASYGVKRVAGTVGAVKRALAAVDAAVILRQWFEYGGLPYRFRLRDVLDAGEAFDVAKGRQAVRIARQAKNVRSRLERLEIAASGSEALPYVGCAVRSRPRFRAIV